jgi:uroporphyrinogen decarboxylase
MKSRERVIETLNHRPTDRVAIDFGATNASQISAIVYNKLKKLLGLKTGEIKVIDILGQYAEIELEVLNIMGGDLVILHRLSPSFGIPVKGFKKGRLTDGTNCLVPDTYNPVTNEKGNLELYKITDGSDEIHPYKLNESPELFDKGKVVAICPKGSHAYTRVYHPFDKVDTIEELDKYAFPEISDEEIAYISKKAKSLYENTDKAVFGMFYGNVAELGQVYWGYENYFINLLARSDLMLHYAEIRTQAMLRDLDKYLKAVGKYIQVIGFSGDLGTQTDLLISPEIYREMIKPFQARLFSFVRNNYPDIKIFYHSCGAIFDLIPDLIEIGIHALNPVQITATGMDPRKLKKEFGKDISFWGGGVDTQGTLNSAPVDKVKAMANEMLEIFSPGGGYVFAQVQCIDSFVPAENVYAAFETAKNFNNL